MAAIILHVVTKVAIVTCSPLNQSEHGGVALLVVNVQNCFMDPKQPLHVVDGANVVRGINDVRHRHVNDLTFVVFVQDVHCADHVAFASQYPDKMPFDIVTLHYANDGSLCTQTNFTSRHARHCEHVAHYVTQILWPDHCIMGTPDTEFSAGLERKEKDVVVKTGNNCKVDTYSAFKDSGGFIQTGLHDLLQRHNVQTVLITGVALQYSVFYTALDSILYGYNTYLVMDATASASDADKDVTTRKLNQLREKGVKLVAIEDLDTEVFGISGSATVNANIRCVYILILLACFAKSLGHHHSI